MAGRTEGVIRDGESYTVAEFMRRTGTADFAFRQLRADGLRVITIRRKRWILGSDWNRHLEKNANGDTS